ncbi:Ldh family oxidoreductase [Chloroflexota bacterium]
MVDKAQDIQLVQAEPVRQFCISASECVGLSREHAELLADPLIQADLRGVYSQGVSRFTRYIRGYQAGGINPKPDIKVVKESKASAVMDADDGMGYIAGYPAMRLAMDKAAQCGVGTVTVRRSNHYGMAAYWSMMALERDMIGYTTTSAPASLAPWGGITPSYGNNPVSYAIPAGEELPLVLDIAMSVTVMGAVRLFALKNEPIPSGWALDKYGEPTTDAQSAIEGLLLPIADYKGYGMALVNDVLCGVLSGGSFGADIPKSPADRFVGSGCCQFFMAFDISHFRPVAEFKERVDIMVRMMKSSQLAKGHDRIYLPGEKEFETHNRQIKEGISYSKEIIDQLKILAQDIGITTDF